MPDVLRSHTNSAVTPGRPSVRLGDSAPRRRVVVAREVATDQDDMFIAIRDFFLQATTLVERLERLVLAHEGKPRRSGE